MCYYCYHYYDCYYCSQYQISFVIVIIVTIVIVIIIDYLHNVDMLCNTYLFGFFWDGLLETARLAGIPQLHQFQKMFADLLWQRPVW